MKFTRRIALLLCLAAVGWAADNTAQGHEAESSSHEQSSQGRMEILKEASKLHYELYRKHYDRALEAMSLAQDIDMVEESTGLTALCLAARDESADAIDMVQPLVAKYGANPRATDAKGFTALHHAAFVGNYAVVEFLANNGADVDAENPLVRGQRITPLYMAYQKGRTRIARFLKLRGAQELDEAVLQDLQLSAALSAAAESLRDLPKGSDPKAAIQARLDSIASVTTQTLQEQGRVAELEAWLRIQADLMEALRNTPVDPEMSKSAYLRSVFTKLAESRGNGPQGDVKEKTSR